MGSDAEVHLLDYERYTDEVVPALRHLLLTGEMAPWLQELWERVPLKYRDADATRLRGTDLRRDCTYLLPDLAFPGTPAAVDIWDAPWEARACRSADCPSRVSCPFHANAPPVAVEDLHLLILDAVASRCLGRSQFLGRSMVVADYAALLSELDVPLGDPIRRLLGALGGRGYVMGYGWANSDGIHGWLTPEETGHLAAALDRLKLPHYPASFEAMQAFWPVRPGPYERPPGWSWEALSLSFIRTVAIIADGEGRGVLWGNSVSFTPDE